MKHFDKFCFGFSHLCTSGASPAWDTVRVIFPAVWPFDQGRDRGVNRPEVTGDLS
jgi:hypothetical protein